MPESNQFLLLLLLLLCLSLQLAFSEIIFEERFEGKTKIQRFWIVDMNHMIIFSSSRPSVSIFFFFFPRILVGLARLDVLRIAICSDIFSGQVVASYHVVVLKVYVWMKVEFFTVLQFLLLAFLCIQTELLWIWSDEEDRDEIWMFLLFVSSKSAFVCVWRMLICVMWHPNGPLLDIFGFVEFLCVFV